MFYQEPHEDSQHQEALESNISTDSQSLISYRGMREVSVTEYRELLMLADIVKDIDHTNLKQDASDEDLRALCNLAKEAVEIFGIGPKTVCVHSSDVAFCIEELQGSDIGVCAVSGFPLGRDATQSKIINAIDAIQAGASEIDMVIHLGALKSGRYDDVEADIRAVCEACHAYQVPVKVILECCLLSDNEKVLACELAERAGADWVKTSTGFAGGGATKEDVYLLRTTVSPSVQVKAAGGMEGVNDASEMRAHGAMRFGASKVLKDAVARARAILYPSEGPPEEEGSTDDSY